MRIVFLSLLLITGAVFTASCYDPRAQQSAIVRELERAGSGNLDVVTIPGLVGFLQNHRYLASVVDAQCAPLREIGDAHWVDTAEGRACMAAHAVTPPPIWNADTRGW